MWIVLFAAGAMAEPPRLVVQLGHTQGIAEVVVSDDGRHVLTTGMDSTAKLWDLASRRELWTVPTTSTAVFVGDRVATTNAELELRDLSGAVVETLTGAAGAGLRAMEAPDGQEALTDGNGTVWTFSPAPKAKRYPISPDGKRIATLDDDRKVVRIHQARNWRVERELDLGSQTQVLFAPDGSLVTGSWDGHVRRYDAASGKELSAFDLGGGQINDIALSGDGTRVAATHMAAGSYHTVGVTVADLNGSILSRHDEKGRWDAVTFAPGGIVAATHEKHEVVLLGPQGGRVGVLTGAVPLWDAAIHPDGNLVALSSSVPGTQVALWDLQSGAPRWVDELGTWADFAFSPQGELGIGMAGVSIRDLTTGAERERVGDLASVFAFSNDGTALFSGGGNSGGSSLALVPRGGGDSVALEGNDSYLNGIAVLPEGRRAVTVGSDGVLRVVDADKAPDAVGELSLGAALHAVDVSPDGQLAVVGGSEHAWLVDLDALEVRHEERWPGHDVYAVAFTHDGQAFVTGDSSSQVRIWDLAGVEQRSLDGHRGWIRSIQPLPDGRLLTASMDGTARLWDLDTGATLTMAHGGGEWVVVSDDGYFDASPNGGSLVSVVTENGVFGVDQFATRFNRPDRMLERMGLGSPAQLAHYEARHDRRIRKLGITLGDSTEVPTASLEVDANGAEATVEVALKAAAAPLARYHLYINDVPVFGAEGRKIQGRSHKASNQIALMAGTNKIEVSTMDSSGAESLRAVASVSYAGETQGALWFLGFGVSKYADSSLDLAYAHQDAKDLADAFAAMATGFEEVHVRVLVDEEVTRQSIADSASWAADANPEDTLVLFIAGHGVHDRDHDARYFYLTHDTNLSDLAGTAAEFELVESLLDGVQPRQKLFLMDTCESGELEDDAQATYSALADSRGLSSRGLTVVSKTSIASEPPRAFLARRDRYIYNDLSRRTGAIVFSSSRGGELSYESETIANGFFTEELLAGLQGAADSDEDEQVSMRELRKYVSRAVPERTANAQHPTVDRDNLEVRFTFPVTSAAEPASLGDPRHTSALARLDASWAKGIPETWDLNGYIDTVDALAKEGADLPSDAEKLVQSQAIRYHKEAGPQRYFDFMMGAPEGSQDYKVRYTSFLPAAAREELKQIGFDRASSFK